MSQHRLCTRKTELALEVKDISTFTEFTRPWWRTLTKGSNAVRYVFPQCLATLHTYNRNEFVCFRHDWFSRKRFQYKTLGVQIYHTDVCPPEGTTLGLHCVLAYLHSISFSSTSDMSLSSSLRSFFLARCFSLCAFRAKFSGTSGTTQATKAVMAETNNWKTNTIARRAAITCQYCLLYLKGRVELK